MAAEIAAPIATGLISGFAFYLATEIFGFVKLLLWAAL